MHPDIIARRCTLSCDQFEDDVRVLAEIRWISILSPMGMVLDRSVCGEVGESATAVVAEDANDRPSGSGELPSLESLSLVSEGTLCGRESRRIPAGTRSDQPDLDRDGVGLHRAHALGPAVGNRFGAFDGEDEVFAEAFLDDLFLPSAGLLRACEAGSISRPRSIAIASLAASRAAAQLFCDCRPACSSRRSSDLCEAWAIFSTRLILPTTRRTWASSYSSPELLDTRTKPSRPGSAFRFCQRQRRHNPPDQSDGAGEIK